MSDPPTGKLALRALVLVLAFFQANAGSVVHALGGEEIRWSESWTMYSGAGRNVCVVTYTNHGDPLDRYAWLGERDEAWYERKPSQRRIEKLRGVRRVGQRLCRALGPGAFVAVTGVCASPRGWTRRVDEPILCR